MRALILATVVGLLAFGGWWVYANWQNEEAVTQFIHRAESEVVITQRGIQSLPTDARLREGLNALATEMGVNLTNTVISHAEVGGAQGPGLDAVSQRLQNAYKTAGVRRRDIQRDGQIQMRVAEVRATRYEVRATLVVQSGLWDHIQEISVIKVLGSHVEM